ncbi:right-handed parallel beta-helix repeat-containing protein [Pontiella agarivorans]|uniref:Right-handed parallel beta-helix repeat-containing protein n=1 Tax=Pontiella agarivorans TaxID=3038953 RepID=A0ABU5MXM1_9BACT|nr:right-handed parallel beta-helix repeat-containing protein [Pontiella agarivorans]MDZ8118940.1 right-handed parallel beta-helix repeat-containing protein [Pontiella agarivorans]
MKKRILSTLILMSITGMVFGQGSLTPPGAPAPTMKSLDEIYSAVSGSASAEVRTPISSLPFTISESGSYYVVSNLTMTATGAHGIYVQADDVTIDLMGFTLTGPGESSGSAIKTGTFNKGCRVFSGTIRNWLGGYAVSAGFESQIQNVIAIENERGLYGVQIKDCQAVRNTTAGIYGGFAGSILNCKASENGTWGISSGQANVIENCSVYYNGSEGILAQYNSIVRNCTSFANQHSGIKGEAGTQIINCNASSNERSGFEITEKCSIENCSASSNGNRPTTHQDGAGIQITGSDNLVKGNTVQDNMWGIHVASERNAIGHNIIGGENTEKGLYITGTENRVFENQVSGTEDNYDMAAGNQLNLLLSEIPETLDWPSTVRLTGSLTVSEQGVNGITVQADNVSIDMAGHSLIGPGTGSGHAVHQLPGFNNFSLSNGNISNWEGTTSYATFSPEPAAVAIAGEYSNLKRLNISDNKGGGVYVKKYGTLSECNVSSNQAYGICVDSGGRIEACRTINNALYGMSLGGSFVKDSQSRGNNVGIYLLNSVAKNCSTSSNTEDGLRLENNAEALNCNSAYNAENGFLVYNGNLRQCTARYNTLCGIDIWDDALIEDCLVEGQNYEGRYTRAGIEVLFDDVTLMNNTVRQCQEGILLQYSDYESGNNMLEGNRIYECGIGINLQQADNILLNNRVWNCSTNYSDTAGNHVPLVSGTVAPSDNLSF